MLLLEDKNWLKFECAKELRDMSEREYCCVYIDLFLKFFFLLSYLRVCGSRHRHDDVDMMKILDPLKWVKIEYLLAHSSHMQ